MRRILPIALLTLGTALGAVGLAPSPAAADPALRLSESTTVGVHNAYEKSQYTYFADALDSGATLLEMDVWVNGVQKKWRVAHDLPIIGSNNNCASGGLRAGARDQDLGVCLDNLRAWHDSKPDHPVLIVKIEMKNGFDGRAGLGAPALDKLIAEKLGAAVFRPADLLGGYPNLDTAARANNWPTRGQLTGKVMFEIVPGTFEQANPFDRYWTDVEYADNLRNLHAAGRFGEAQIFPAVLGAASGDPRARYADAGRRPWFVVFDGGATNYVGGAIDPAWYDTNHYPLVMTGAHEVAPAIDARNPTPEQARARVALLAAAHASVVTSDWTAATQALPLVLRRG
jgi:hypothetical protein